MTLREETLKVVQLSETAMSPNMAASYRYGSSTNGVEMVTFQGEDGWYGYLRGIKDGDYFEGEEDGPYADRAAAEAAMRQYYADDND